MHVSSLQMNVGAMVDLLGFGGKKSSMPQWFKALLMRATILGGFTLTFLYLRFKLNKTPPIFSGKLLRL